MSDSDKDSESLSLNNLDVPKGFFAYPSSPPAIPPTISAAISAINATQNAER